MQICGAKTLSQSPRPLPAACPGPQRGIMRPPQSEDPFLVYSPAPSAVSTRGTHVQKARAARPDRSGRSLRARAHTHTRPFAQTRPKSGKTTVRRGPYA